MNVTNDKTDAHAEAWPFVEIMKAGRERARLQQRHFDEFISENNPRLAADLAAEAARFDIVSRTVIEPAMREFAEDATWRGWHVSVVRDDRLDRLALLATPGIRFYCSRRSSRIAVGDLIWPACFVAFYGCAQNSAVLIHMEPSQFAEDAVASSEPRLEYPEVTSENVRAVLVTFLEDLERIG